MTFTLSSWILWRNAFYVYSPLLTDFRPVMQSVSLLTSTVPCTHNALLPHPPTHQPRKREYRCLYVHIRSLSLHLPTQAATMGYFSPLSCFITFTPVSSFFTCFSPWSILYLSDFHYFKIADRCNLGKKIHFSLWFLRFAVQDCAAPSVWGLMRMMDGWQKVCGGRIRWRAWKQRDRTYILPTSISFSVSNYDD